MTKGEKEKFCLWAAFLISPPNKKLLTSLTKGKIWAFLKKIITKWGSNPQLFAPSFRGDFPEEFLLTLKAEYNRLFIDPQGAKISLVESTYKTWTINPSCRLAWANKKGLLMSDYALHLQDIFGQLSLETPPEYQSTPDHLIIELEFLSLLYRLASLGQVRNFINDHLDWIPDLQKKIEQAGAILFYRQTIELINLFLLYEKKNEVH